MTITKLYTLNCTDCSTSFCEKDTGAWTFETKEEIEEYAKESGWEFRKEVPNGSLWDFCPRCISKRNHK